VTDGEWAVRTEGITKNFGNWPALRGVDLAVRPGEVLCLFGPNGAGKTTLVRIIAGLSRPNSGKVWLAGWDMAEDGMQARSQVGLVAHQTLLYDDLSAKENLLFYGEMYDVPDLNRRVRDVLAQVGLTYRANDPVRVFSRGMQQRLALARAILHRPSVLLLDEPDTGLDVEAIAALRGVLQDDGGQRRAAVMTSHNLERGLSLSDRVAILVSGRVAYQEETTELTKERLEEAYQRCVGARN